MLEVIIGLVFTFLLLSLLVTTMNELVASWRGWRGFYLEEGLKKILEFKDNEDSYKKFKENALYQQLHNNPKVLGRVSNAPSYLSAKTFVAIFFKALKGKVTVQELIQQLPPNSQVRQVLDQLKEETQDQIENFKMGAASMYEEVIEILNGADGVEEKLNTYIKKLPEESQIQNVFQQFLNESEGKPDIFKRKVENWYTSLVMVLNGEVSVKNIIDQLPEKGKLREVLEQLREEAGDNFEDFQNRVEQWYLELMDRATGWYKKHLQVVTFLFGLGVAVFFNADTFAIYSRLSTNSSARSEIVQLANDFVAKNETTGLTSSEGGSYEDLKSKVNTLLNDDIKEVKNPLGLGWSQVKSVSLFTPDGFWIWVQRVLGWLVTALAISLGAPFWFDILKKFVSIRGSGGTPSQNTTKVVINTNEKEK